MPCPASLSVEDSRGVDIGDEVFDDISGLLESYPSLEVRHRGDRCAVLSSSAKAKSTSRCFKTPLLQKKMASSLSENVINGCCEDVRGAMRRLFGIRSFRAM